MTSIQDKDTGMYTHDVMKLSIFVIQTAITTIIKKLLL